MIAPRRQTAPGDGHGHRELEIEGQHRAVPGEIHGDDLGEPGFEIDARGQHALIDDLGRLVQGQPLEPAASRQRGFLVHELHLGSVLQPLLAVDLALDCEARVGRGIVIAGRHGQGNPLPGERFRDFRMKRSPHGRHGWLGQRRMQSLAGHHVACADYELRSQL